MISKAFQDIVSQMSEVFPKRFGITDSTGLVLAASGPEISEDMIEDLISVADEAGKVYVREGYTIRLLDGRPYPEYIVYVEGTDDLARYCCNAVTVAANNVRRFHIGNMRCNRFFHFLFGIFAQDNNACLLLI